MKRLVLMIAAVLLMAFTTQMGMAQQANTPPRVGGLGFIEFPQMKDKVLFVAQMRDEDEDDNITYRFVLCKYAGTMCWGQSDQGEVSTDESKENTTSGPVEDGYLHWFPESADNLNGDLPSAFAQFPVSTSKSDGLYNMAVSVRDGNHAAPNDPWGDSEYTQDFYIIDGKIVLEPTKSPFRDMSLDTLEGKAAAELYYRGAVSGYADGTFRADTPVNRAEAMKMLTLANLGEVREYSYKAVFRDVSPGQWFTPFVLAANEQGIIKGYADGTFRPNQTINTAEFLKMYTKVFYGDNIAEDMSTRFVDVSPSDWYAPFVWITDPINPFPKRERVLAPAQPVTRGDVAIALYQRWNYLDETR